MTAPITLTIPDDPRYHGVARLVVGGLAARLELSYEHLEDLQLALSSVLESDGYTRGPAVHVELLVADDAVDIAVGPLNGDLLRTDLAKDAADGIALGRLLRTVVEDVEVEEREDGEWLRLRKRVKSVKPGKA